MFTPSLQPAIKQICGKNRGLLPLAYTAIKPATQNSTHSKQHSLFSKADKKYHSGASVAAPSFDAELHIETTTIMFADVVESVRLIEPDELGIESRTCALPVAFATCVGYENGRYASTSASSVDARFLVELRIVVFESSFWLYDHCGQWPYRH